MIRVGNKNYRCVDWWSVQFESELFPSMSVASGSAQNIRRLDVNFITSLASSSSVWVTVSIWASSSSSSSSSSFSVSSFSSSHLRNVNVNGFWSIPRIFQDLRVIRDSLKIYRVSTGLFRIFSGSSLFLFLSFTQRFRTKLAWDYFAFLSRFVWQSYLRVRVYVFLCVWEWKRLELFLKIVQDSVSSVLRIL